MINISEILYKKGDIGSLQRIKAIASMDLGKRSEAAKRVLKKRLDRQRNGRIIQLFDKLE